MFKTGIIFIRDFSHLSAPGGPTGYRCRDSRSPMLDIRPSPARSSRSSRPGRWSSGGKSSGATESLFAVAASLDSSWLMRNNICRLVNVRFCYYGLAHFLLPGCGGSLSSFTVASGCSDSIGSLLRSDIDDCRLMKNKIHGLENV